MGRPGSSRRNGIWDQALARDTEEEQELTLLLSPDPPPGYKVTKIREPSSPNRLGLLFQVMLPEIKEGVRPIRRFMSAFEQRREIPNRAIQYLLVRPLFAS